MTQLFEIAVFYNDETKEHVGIVKSLIDDKGAVVRNTKLRKMLTDLARLVRHKAVELETAPRPEPSRIIQLNGHGPAIAAN